MKSIPFLILAFFCITATAQPPKRLAEEAARQQARTLNAPRGTSYRDFPSAPPMPEDVVWKRDIYRKLDLNNEKNAVLYYPATPQQGQVNLFTYLMKCLLRRQLKAYKYDVISGVENFSPENEISAKQIMDDRNIFYEIKDGRMRVQDIDLSLKDVRKYYIKESVYYNQHTSTFRTQVTAICPVIVRGDAEFGGADTEYPVFWISFQDAAPLLAKLMLMESSLNNAATISAEDYFTMNHYEGDIYNIVNLQDKLLFNSNANDSTVVKAQNHIENELKQFRKDIWGQNDKANMIDTVNVNLPDTAATAPAPKEQTKTLRRRTPATRRTTVQRTPKAPKSKAPKVKTASTKSAGLSVRRQRH